MPSDKDYARKTHTFQFDEVGSDGEHYIGKFTCKKVTIADLRQIGLIKAELNGGYYTVFDDNGKPTGKGLEPSVDYLNSMWAHCQVALITKPTWFDDQKLEDVTILRKVYKEIDKFEDSFRKHREDDRGGEEDSKGQPDGEEQLAEVPGTVVEEALPTIHKKR